MPQLLPDPSGIFNDAALGRFLENCHCEVRNVVRGNFKEVLDGSLSDDFHANTSVARKF